MNDTELFELCKSVYEKTGWNYTENSIGYILSKTTSNADWQLKTLPTDVFNGMNQEDGYDYVCPLYTSDYQLEKLPKPGTNLKSGKTGQWFANYVKPNTRSEVSGIADTPLKALLKLTIALHEAGILTNASN